MKKSELVKKIDALKIGKEMGCSGAHKDKFGNWMPCASMEELERLSNIAETSKWRSVVVAEKKTEVRSSGKKNKKRKQGFEKLRELPIQGIETIDGGGLVSGNFFASKADQGAGPSIRETDVDVFMDPESARARSRQLGCIGISRRISKNGRTIWMPCTNMSDYANRTGSTALGRRNIENNRRREMTQVARTIVSNALAKAKLKKKSAITEELGYGIHRY